MTSLRLCILGNSHLAALKDAWDAGPERWPGLDLTMIGGHGATLLETSVEQGRLVPISDAARGLFARYDAGPSIDLAAFDGFIIAGAQIALARLLALYQDARWTALPSLQWVSDLATEPVTLISNPAACAIAEIRLADSLAIRLVDRLRTGTDRPILVTSQPRSAVAAIDAGRKGLGRLADTVRNGDAEALSSLFDQTAMRVLRRHGARFLPQPPETRAADVFTSDPYVKGAIRLSVTGRQQQPKDDLIHANGAYGALVLDQLAEAFAA